jgi:penicillin-binding protein 1A
MSDVATETSVQPDRDRHVPKHAPSKKKRGFFRRFWWVFVLVPVVVLLASFGVLYIAYVRIQLPDTLPPIRTSYLYDRDGELLTSLHGAVDRKIVPLSQISENLQNAVIATEDAGFYSHPGIDIKGIISAAWTDLVKHDEVVGASTITQQLVKNVYAGQYVENPDGSTEYIVPPRTIKEKIREALLAIKLETENSKQQILAKYLNTVYFGHGAYGAEAAAETYFGKHASELTVSESAVMAAVLHAPSLYDPIKSKYDNKFRRDYTLDQMAKYGYISADEAAELKADVCCGIPPSQRQTVNRIDSPAGSEYFVDYARDDLFERYGSAKVYGGGLNITTTLDLDMQRAAKAAVADHLPSDGDPEAAVVTIDNKNGQVLAMVGGRNFKRSKLNLATQPCDGCGRQAGSAFKPFTLAAALTQDYSLSALWSGPSSITIPDETCAGPDGYWTPVNAGDGEAGTFTLLQATEHSVNTVYAQLIADMNDGPAAVVNMADKLGIKSELPQVCSVTLGSVQVNPLEMTNAYATLADRGVYHRANPLLEVDRSNGDSIDDKLPTKARAELRPVFADQVTYALRTVVTGGTGTAASLDYPYGYTVYGKTGTAQDNVDAWFCGYTQEISTCVWVGYPDSERPLEYVEGVPSVYGGTIPAEIWHDYMAKALAIVCEGKDTCAEPFAPPTEFTGYKGPSTPVPSPTPSPTATPSATDEPTETQTPSPTEPSPTEPSPTDKPRASGRFVEHPGLGARRRALQR